MHTAFVILLHTPLWAFLLLAIVVLRSVAACADHCVPIRRVVWLPLVIQAWALWRVLASPAAQLPAAALAWGVGTLAALALCRRFGYPRGLWLDPAGGQVFVPGSRLVPVLMLSIYALHFTGGVLAAMQPALAREPRTVSAFSLAYGMIGGLFMARTLSIWRLLANRFFARG